MLVRLCRAGETGVLCVSRGNVERIVSAETRVEGDREMHHIRYMTKDGKVRTTKVRGRRLR